MTSGKTKFYGFPHYAPSDHPDFLDEINKAYAKMDEIMHARELECETLMNMLKSHSAQINELRTQLEQLSEAVANK